MWSVGISLRPLTNQIRESDITPVRSKYGVVELLDACLANFTCADTGTTGRPLFSSAGEIGYIRQHQIG